MSKKVDINVDVGEGFEFDEDLMECATSANVCCGRHAGSWELTKETIYLCHLKGVRIGMHPGFPDREHMGRERMKIDEVPQYANSIFEQVIQFQQYEPAVAYVKPHGAFYNMLVEHSQPDTYMHLAARLTLEGVLVRVLLPTMLLSGCPLAASFQRNNIRVVAEGFADRRYQADGTLRSRSNSDAVLTDKIEIKEQVLRLARTVDSICVHGDTPDCVQIARLVYGTLEDNGFEVGF